MNFTFDKVQHYTIEIVQFYQAKSDYIVMNKEILKREDLRKRYNSYKKLSPEKRQQALELYKKWQNLPENQQQKIRKKAGNLKHLPPREREKALKKSPNWQELSDEEQKVLRDTLYRD